MMAQLTSAGFDQAYGIMASRRLFRDSSTVPRLAKTLPRQRLIVTECREIVFNVETHGIATLGRPCHGPEEELDELCVQPVDLLLFAFRAPQL